jgi:hypothetical protein
MGVNVEACPARVAEYEACFDAHYDEFLGIVLAPCAEGAPALPAPHCRTRKSSGGIEFPIWFAMGTQCLDWFAMS